MTFSLAVKTAKDLSDIALGIRAKAIKAACNDRITININNYAQLNLASASAAGMLSLEQQITYAQAVAWISETRAACNDIIANTTLDYTDNKNWPACTEDIVALANDF